MSNLPGKQSAVSQGTDLGHPLPVQIASRLLGPASCLCLGIGAAWQRASLRLQNLSVRGSRMPLRLKVARQMAETQLCTLEPPVNPANPLNSVAQHQTVTR